MNFGDIHWLWLLWLLVPLLALLIWSWQVKQRLLSRFISPRLLATLTAGVSKQRQKIRVALFVLAVASLIFSLARPQLGFSLEESKQAGLDIVVAIDTSKSMLADDVQPNRLQRAKLAAVDLMRLAKSDRLGLVAFAGGAFLQCPLSLDEEAFRQSVDFLDVNVIPQGGTALAEAIQAARAAFKEETENHKILVLFTDGEDNDDAEAAIQTAREGKKAGLRIFTIGVGTPNGEVLSTKDPYGNRVFIKDSQGNVVKSRLNENLLQQIAKDTDGFYLPLTGARSMDVLYERGLAPLPKSESTTRTIRQYHERFQWFIGAAILLLLAEMMFPERSKSPRSNVQSPGPAVGTTVSIVLLFCAANAFGAASDALKNYARGKFSEARTEFERLARKSPEDARLRYNAGAAAFQDEDYDTALKHFNQTLSARDLKLQEQSYYNLGNTHFRLGEKTDDAKEKQQQWEQAIHQYESALKLNTNDMDAQFNMEVVKKKLEELKQQQQQNKQDQNKDDQNKDDQSKDQQKSDQQKKEDKKNEQQKSEQEKQEEQKKQEQESQKKDQQSQKQDEQKQDQQQAKDERGEKSDKSSEQQNYARVMQMTPQQAQQLLDAQKSEERAMIFQPMIQRTNRPKDRVFKDW
jgi:Ca-activated chloride channel homolog